MLKGNSIIIKPLEYKHLEALRLLRNDETTNVYLTTIIPVNEVMQKAWFEKISLDDTKMYLAIENKKNEFVGIIRADEWDKVNKSVRIGIDIVPTQRQKGLATEAYKLFLEYLFHHLSINRIWLLVVEYNKAAFSLYTKFGFKVEGKQREALFRNNKFNDYIMMSILKKEYEKT